MPNVSPGPASSQTTNYSVQTNRAPSVSQFSTAPAVIAHRAIPFIIAPSGTVGIAGRLTLGTALATTYANAYVYLPAAAVSATAGAGWYFVQFTSATLGTVYGNQYIPYGSATIPAVLIAPVLGAGAFVGGPTGIVGPQILVGGGTMGPNGILRMMFLTSYNTTAGTKTITLTFGGSTVLNAAIGTSGAANTFAMLINRGVPNSQVSFAAASSSGIGTAGGAPTYLTVNTSATQVLALTATVAVATDWMVWESYLLEIISAN